MVQPNLSLPGHRRGGVAALSGLTATVGRPPRPPAGLLPFEQPSLPYVATVDVGVPGRARDRSTATQAACYHVEYQTPLTPATNTNQGYGAPG